MQTRINCLLPEIPQYNLPVLILLHGLGDDENTWLERTQLEQFAQDKQIAILMPRADRSYYANTRSGMRYFDYVSQELVQRCGTWLPLTSARSQTFIAGLSMGGFGALKSALNHPDLYAGVFSLSGVTDIFQQWESHPERDAWYTDAFGHKDSVKGTDNDLPNILRHWQEHTERPYIWQLCGLEDPFLEMNRKFHSAALVNHFVADLELVDGGHEWAVWNNGIKMVLDKIDQIITAESD
jgi:S-formylglutathione hydrolase FrmB